MVDYTDDLTAITPEQLDGFFGDWPVPPSAAVLLDVLRSSTHAVLARDGDAYVGFVNVLSDGRMAAYIPLLEVLPTHRGQGIGLELVRRIQALVEGVYMLDAVCDEDMTPFYEKAGFMRLAGMASRNYRAPVLTAEA